MSKKGYLMFSLLVQGSAIVYYPPPEDPLMSPGIATRRTRSVIILRSSQTGLGCPDALPTMTFNFRGGLDLFFASLLGLGFEGGGAGIPSAR